MINDVCNHGNSACYRSWNVAWGDGYYRSFAFSYGSRNPFDGPVGAVQIGYLGWGVCYQSYEISIRKIWTQSLLAGKKGSINMIECESLEFPDDLMKQAMDLGQSDWWSLWSSVRLLKTLDIRSQEVMFNVSGNHGFCEILHYRWKLQARQEIQKFL